MKKITLGRLFELYVCTLNKFGIYLLCETDTIISNYIFEMLDIDIGYCSDRILNEFLAEGMINEEILNASVNLLKNYRKLESNMQIRDVEIIKKSLEWKKLLEQFDEVKAMIMERWTEEELNILYSSKQIINLSLSY